jgi:hypothetical protein
MSNTTQTQVATQELSKIDQLGFLNEQIKDLTEQAEALKTALKAEAAASGATTLIGELFVASYKKSERSTFDHKKLISDYNMTEADCAPFMKVTCVTSLTVQKI